jgi:two-component system, chemotaxis family, protein-glutamate methylesterase/glutaminase
LSIKHRVKVLVVDDSLLFREFLVRGIAADAGIEVVGTAADPYEAKDKILELQPQVVTLDVEMPKMNGIEFLRRLMPQYPIPVVVVSAISNNVFDALNAGAVDFVTKPEAGNNRGMELLINELIVKIKVASIAKVGHWKHDNSLKNEDLTSTASNITCNTIAIGASTGGTEAIAAILKTFPRFAPGTVVVQHMPPVFTKMYADRLNDCCQVEVKEAENGDRIVPGRVLIAPGDFQMKIKRNGSVYTVECFKGEKVNGHCPSVDVLFQSVAELVGNKAIGVILTGMGYDGAKGLLQMRKNGARTLGQDQESSVVYGMPKVAYDIGAVEKQVPLTGMSRAILSLTDI